MHLNIWCMVRNIYFRELKEAKTLICNMKCFAAGPHKFRPQQAVALMVSWAIGSRSTNLFASCKKLFVIVNTSDCCKAGW